MVPILTDVMPHRRIPQCRFHNGDDLHPDCFDVITNRVIFLVFNRTFRFLVVLSDSISIGN